MTDAEIARETEQEIRAALAERILTERRTS